MSDNLRVAITLELDLDKIEQQSMEWWARALHVQFEDPGKPKWSEIYAALTMVAMGSEHYQLFSMTALDDVRRWSDLVVSKSLEFTMDGSPSKVKVIQDLTVPPTPPTPPRPPAPAKKADTGV